MTITPYLAMTAAEIKCTFNFPNRLAWMACHFSLYSTGLSNLPDALPPDSMLIVNDIIPMNGHDPDTILTQLTQCIDRFQCSSVLLDFQREPTQEILNLTNTLVKALPCPTAVTEAFSVDTQTPIFLPPCPPHRPLKEHLSHWRGREIWLEIGKEISTIILTENGSSITVHSGNTESEEGLPDKNLMCHYQSKAEDGQILFTIWRTSSDIDSMLQNAESLGVSKTIGLYQEQWI